MEGGWVVIEASHTVSSGLNVTCHMLIYALIVMKIIIYGTDLTQRRTRMRVLGYHSTSA